MRTLLELFTTKELRILQKYPGLKNKVQVLAKAIQTELIRRLQVDHDLIVSPYEGGEVWVDIEKLEARMPSLLDKSTHCGWFLSLENGDFSKWAKSFLLQEIKVNVWLKYFQHKSRLPTGSGGNYL